jgi:hypothetical protein
MFAAGQAEETAPAESPPPSQPVAETAVAPVQATNGPAATSASLQFGDAQFIPALHHQGVPADWTAELVLAEESTDDAASPADGVSQVLAFADEHVRSASLDQGLLLSGTLPLDLEALEQGVDRFFARLEENGRSMFGWPGVANIGAWLATGVTATAFFELARRTAQTRLTSAAGCGAWRTSRETPDSELLFFHGPDEP